VQNRQTTAANLSEINFFANFSLFRQNKFLAPDSDSDKYQINWNSEAHQHPSRKFQNFASAPNSPSRPAPLRYQQRAKKGKNWQSGETGDIYIRKRSPSKCPNAQKTAERREKGSKFWLLVEIQRDTLPS
jgi:hypothetical protein